MFHAAGGCDGLGRTFEPAALLFEGRNLRAAGTPQEIGTIANANVVVRPRSVLIPPLVNAHAHLDLTDIGTVELDRSAPGGFAAWLASIIGLRPKTPEAIRRAVKHGAELSLRGGVGWVGDIAGLRSMDAFEALAEAPLGGVSFLETFGLHGTREAEALEWIASLKPQTRNGVTLGVQPHALYSASDRVFDAALECGLPVSTHLAESAEETEFALRLEGALVELLRNAGVWSDAIPVRKARPAEWFARRMAGRSSHAVVAHVNEVTTEEIRLLRERGACVAYCPRSNAFFDRPGPAGELHRWRDMLAMDLCVAIGTDGVVSLRKEEHARRLSPLDEIALLRRRGGADDATLLKMATVHGLRALGVPEDQATFAPGEKMGWLAVTGPGSEGSLGAIFDPKSEIEWIVAPREIGESG
ncbi:MAG: amidohydrolase family protein [Planctomycetes bacterium]|nr:amidohydrolase family protein [Planctomycetota bacterium]